MTRHALEGELLYTTRHGKAFVADALRFMPGLKDNSVNLVLTSPPYALHFKKEYGNAAQADYIRWFLPFAKEIYRLLQKDGSFVLDIGRRMDSGSANPLAISL